MIRVLVLVLAMTSVAHADTAAHLDKARKFHDHGDYVHARDELLAAYEEEPRPELLFALGQIEFNLHDYKQAIAYYEQFAATNPEPAQAALVQQAIGAARIELGRPAPLPPPRPKLPPHHQWEIEDTGLVAFGGLAAAVGGGLIYESQKLASDHSGTLGAYDHRIAQARTARIAAGGCFAAGAIALGVALIHWRVHLVETVEIKPTSGGATISLGGHL